MEEKKKKKAYVKPEMHVEEFTPNEYVSACINLFCTIWDGKSRCKKHNYEQHTDGEDGQWHGSGCYSGTVYNQERQVETSGPNAGVSKVTDLIIDNNAVTPDTKFSNFTGKHPATWTSAGVYKHTGYATADGVSANAS